MKTEILLLAFAVATTWFGFPSISVSACSEGNTCSWSFVETVNSNSYNIWFAYDFCHDIHQSTLPSCSNYPNGYTIHIYRNFQQHYSSNNSWSHCTFTITSYKNNCIPIPTCNDDIQNQGEEGIDCGGPCQCCSIATYYRDADGDTFGNPNIMIQACAAPAGYVSIAGDLYDNDNTINPGASEVCWDTKDNDCNGFTDCYDNACKGSPSCVTINVEGAFCPKQ